jgi:hypothetical protein
MADCGACWSRSGRDEVFEGESAEIDIMCQTLEVRKLMRFVFDG